MWLAAGAAACPSLTSDWRCPGLSTPLAPIPRIQEIFGTDLHHMLQPGEGIRDNLRQIHRLYLRQAEGSCGAGRGTSPWPHALSAPVLALPSLAHSPRTRNGG